MLHKIKIGGVPEPFNLAWTEPLETVEWSYWPAGSGAMGRALLDGQLDAAFVLSESAVYHGLTIHSVQTPTPLIWGVYGKQNTSFRPGRVAISRQGSGSHLMAQLFLAEQGYDLNGVQFLAKGSFEAMCQAIEEEKADFFLWEKNFALSHCKNLNFYTYYQAGWPAFVLALAPGFDALPQLEEALEHSYRRLEQWISDSKVGPLIQMRYGLDEPSTNIWLSENRWHTKKVKLEASVYQMIEKQLKDVGQIFFKNLA